MVAMLEGPESWLFVAVVAALVFGSSKLPQLARSLGRSKSEFEKALREGKEPENADDPKSADPDESSLSNDERDDP